MYIAYNSNENITMTDAYDQVKKDMGVFFPDNTSKETIDPYQANIQFERKSIKYSNPSNNLPPIQFNNSNKISILDTLRINGFDADDLGLPQIKTNSELTLYNENTVNDKTIINEDTFTNKSIIPQRKTQVPSINTEQWKLSKLLLGHTGQITSTAIDPFNSYFVTGSSDSTIKVWDLITGELQLTLSAHIMAVKGLVISDRHPYMFSCSDDKTVKCWDLEKNSVIRDYHGHLSSVYSIDLHPELDLIITGGRDSSVRVWDIRTRNAIHTLSGHASSINKVKCRNIDPQIISCSQDSTVKTWDLAAGKCLKTLTFHSKSVRSFTNNENFGNKGEIITASSDGIKKFSLPDCQYLQDMNFWENHDVVNEGNLMINTISSSDDGMVFAGCDNGKYAFWNWENGQMIQNGLQTPVPGSLSSESGILCSTFDRSGERLITGGIDKSVRIWNKT